MNIYKFPSINHKCFVPNAQVSTSTNLVFVLSKPTANCISADGVSVMNFNSVMNFSIYPLKTNRYNFV